MASSKWKSIDELQAATEGRPVVFWGASNWIERTRNLIDLEIAFIVDVNPANHGIEFQGAKICPPTALMEVTPRPFVIISTANYASVIDQLHELDFTMGDDFCCAPPLNERREKDELLAHKQKVLIASSMHATSDTRGGGLYLYDTATREAKKVYTGKCRGLSRLGDAFFVVDMMRGIVRFDNDFDEQGLIELQKNAEPHGLHADEKTGKLYVGQPGRDSVAVYAADGGKLTAEYFMSEKWQHNGKDNHHVNDPFVFENSLYVSMFSFSGNWLHEVYDGGILEIDLVTGKVVGPVVTDLWMPHSVTRVDGNLCYLNSMLGELYSMGRVKNGVFTGFARGLGHDGKYFYVGTSQHNYPEKLFGNHLNIGMDAGFFMFDSSTKMSRFFPLPETQGIHDLMPLIRN